MRASAPKPQDDAPSKLPVPVDSVPACSIDNETKLVNWPTKSITAEESALGSNHSWDLGFILFLGADFLSLYEASSRLDHLDLGVIPTAMHP